jgi:hypothetical protein
MVTVMRANGPWKRLRQPLADAGRFADGRGTAARMPGCNPQPRSYASFASFNDPDGNVGVLQERVILLPTTSDSASDLASALRRAVAAHGEREDRTGQPDPVRPNWSAEYMVREQAGEEFAT